MVFKKFPKGLRASAINSAHGSISKPKIRESVSSKNLKELPLKSLNKKKLEGISSVSDMRKISSRDSNYLEPSFNSNEGIKVSNVKMTLKKSPDSQGELKKTKKITQEKLKDILKGSKIKKIVTTKSTCKIVNNSTEAILKKKFNDIKGILEISSPSFLASKDKTNGKKKIVSEVSSPNSLDITQKNSFMSSKCISFAILDVSYKELMKKPEKNKKSIITISSSTSTKNKPLNLTESVSACNNENKKKIIPRKLNKIEQNKEDLIKWIFECIVSINS